MGLFRKKIDKMIFYCKAKVVKDAYGFNYLSYEMDDVDTNSKFVEQFDNGETVEIYVKRSKKTINKRQGNALLCKKTRIRFV